MYLEHLKCKLSTWVSVMWKDSTLWWVVIVSIAICELDLNNDWYNNLLSDKWPPKFELRRLKTVAISHMVRGKLSCSYTRDGKHGTPIHNSVWMCMAQWYQALLIWRLLYKSSPRTMWYSNSVFKSREFKFKRSLVTKQVIVPNIIHNLTCKWLILQHALPFGVTAGYSWNMRWSEFDNDPS